MRNHFSMDSKHFLYFPTNTKKICENSNTQYYITLIIDFDIILINGRSIKEKQTLPILLTAKDQLRSSLIKLEKNEEHFKRYFNRMGMTKMKFIYLLMMKFKENGNLCEDLLYDQSSNNLIFLFFRDH